MTQYGQQKKPDYLKTGYFDDKGNIKCELLTTVAEQKAKELGESGITSTQLRRFFIQVRAIERQLGQKYFPQLIPEIQGLKPLVANYVGRGKNQFERQRRESLKRFIDSNVEVATKEEKNFIKGFIPHFESVVAYFKYYFPGKD